MYWCKLSVVKMGSLMRAVLKQNWKKLEQTSQTGTKFTKCMHNTDGIDNINQQLTDNEISVSFMLFNPSVFSLR